MSHESYGSPNNSTYGEQMKRISLELVSEGNEELQEVANKNIVTKRKLISVPGNTLVNLSQIIFIQ